MGMKIPLLLVMLALPTGCSQSGKRTNPAPSASAQSNMEGCTSAAKATLGQDAEVIKCGDLTHSGRLEALVVNRLVHERKLDDEMYVRHLAIIRKQGEKWVTALEANKEIKNPAGYIGIDFIDDSYVSSGYRLRLYDRRTDGVPALVLMLTILDNMGAPEGTPVQICWNPSINRFQEFTSNEDPEGFRTEVKNPRHATSGAGVK